MEFFSNFLEFFTNFLNFLQNLTARGPNFWKFFRKFPLYIRIYVYVGRVRPKIVENLQWMKICGWTLLLSSMYIRNPKKYIPMAGPWSGQNLSPYILRIYVYVYTYTFYVAVLATLALSRKVLALAGNRATLRFTCSRWQLRSCVSG